MLKIIHIPIGWKASPYEQAERIAAADEPRLQEKFVKLDANRDALARKCESDMDAALNAGMQVIAHSVVDDTDCRLWMAVLWLKDI